MKKTLLVLAAVAGFTSFAQNAQAALVTINIGSTGFNIGGINGGVSPENYISIYNFPISGNLLYLDNYNSYRGVSGDSGLVFATGTDVASPVKFSLGAEIGSSTFRPSAFSVFKAYDYVNLGDLVSPDFGPGSYMGFQTRQGNYGWLEVTWTASTGEFRILSGAYEDQIIAPILAGAGGAAPIPEPGTWAAMAIFAGGAAFAGWRRRKSAKIAA
jgi:hypothetical protein